MKSKPPRVSRSLLLAFLASLFVIIVAAVRFSAGPSVACLFPAVSPPQPGVSSRILESGRQRRCYLLFMPASYDPAKPTALVIVLHGFAGNASGLRRIAVWEPVAARENFLVVYPEGSSFPLRWNIGPVANIPTVDDVKFIRDLIMEMRATTSADPSRIYVARFSNGGQMTHRLACQLADQIAAVGIVDGFDGGMLEECAPSRSIPVMAFLGTADPLAEVIYPAWFRALMNVAPDPAPPLPENAIALWAFGWAQRNGCATAPIRLPSTSNAAAILFDQCQDDAQVFLYRVEGQGHAWPGGPSLPLLGESVSDINASEALWAFFQEHPLPKLP